QIDTGEKIGATRNEQPTKFLFNSQDGACRLSERRSLESFQHATGELAECLAILALAEANLRHLITLPAFVKDIHGGVMVWCRLADQELLEVILQAGVNRRAIDQAGRDCLCGQPHDVAECEFERALLKERQGRERQVVESSCLFGPDRGIG